jgi:hypothetical protein
MLRLRRVFGCTLAAAVILTLVDEADARRRAGGSYFRNRIDLRGSSTNDIPCVSREPRLTIEQLRECIRLDEWITAEKEEKTSCQPELERMRASIDLERNADRYNLLVRSYNLLVQKERHFLSVHNERLRQFNSTCADRCYLGSDLSTVTAELKRSAASFGQDDAVVRYCD